MINPNDQVYPIVEPNDVCSVTIGLTKRELFAAMAMQGILSNGEISHEVEVAKNALLYADALINELNKPLS